MMINDAEKGQYRCRSGGTQSVSPGRDAGENPNVIEWKENPKRRGKLLFVRRSLFFGAEGTRLACDFGLSVDEGAD